ncbi:uncharacterized protein LOC111710708 [Eurytemora carolleeae]|uniref:uncharacterized protein LOC111710708 n=1 Tax=Eurytemora carolleeae TaxID=1294199 RepID=UPI000C78CAF6|nr:uncharacterized protein LOC111710708 [Eurytemora carolleeae]|eukprot:XP_023340593.1 uncharacterized protein LOC111710708 [Eurytemora affinis]
MGVQCAAACTLTPPCNELRFENGVCELGRVFCWGPPGELMSIYQSGPCLPKKAGANSTIGCPADEVDCTGEDLRLGNNATTWEECAIQCWDDELCLYWSWDNTENTSSFQMCYIKNGCNRMSSHINRISGSYDCVHEKNMDMDLG